MISYKKNYSNIDLSDINMSKRIILKTKNMKYNFFDTSMSYDNDDSKNLAFQIFEIIKKVNSEGMTVLLVEQNARMALKISHRAYCVETGKITLAGKGADLLKDSRIVDSYLVGHSEGAESFVRRYSAQRRAD